MVLETICKRSHVECVAPAVVTGEIAYWGSAADYCSRKDKDGRECEEAVVASRILMDSGRRIPVIASPAPGAVLRVDASEEARITGERQPLLRMLDEVVEMLKERGVTLSGQEREIVRDLADKAGVSSYTLDTLVAEGEPDLEDEEQGCWHYDYQRFCTQCDPASYEEAEEIDETAAGPSFFERLRARVDGWLRRPVTMVALLVGLGAVASLILTILFALQGQWILALLA